MKKNFQTSILYLTSILLFSLSSVSCSDDNDTPPEMVFRDYANSTIAFMVTDEDGQNLLDPKVEGNLLGDAVVTYREKTFKTLTKEEEQNPSVRFNMPRKLALRSESLRKNDTDVRIPALTFGEFSPESNYKNESFVIDWGDGSKDTVKFDLFITWNGEDPSVTGKVYLNGELQDTGLIELVKKKKVNG